MDEDTAVNPLDFSTRIKRDVAMHKAAQILADAHRCWTGERPQQLRTLDPHQREWYRQTARNLIEIFEAMVYGREAEGTAAAAAEQRRLTREAGIQIARSQARVGALERGHELAPFSSADGSFDETATCTRCDRALLIQVREFPLRIATSGEALREGCLVAATREGE